jgi:hypothetical protein
MAEQTPTEQRDEIMHVQRTIARSLNTLLLQLNQST